MAVRTSAGRRAGLAVRGGLTDGRVVLAAAVALAGGATRTASAAPLAWDVGMTPGGTAAAPTGAGGTGNWDLTTPVWSNGTADVAFTNGSSAVFGGAAGTVTLTAPISALGLSFNTAGYTVASSAANPLTITTGGLTTATGGTTTITGAVTIGGTQTWTVAAGDALQFGATLSSPTAANVFQINSLGTTNLTGTTAVVGKSTLAGSGTFNLSGTEAFVTGSGDYAGISGATVNVTAGTASFSPGTGNSFFIGNSGSATAPSTLNITGGTVTVPSATRLFVGDSFNGTLTTAGDGTITIGGGATTATFNTGTGTNASNVLGNTVATGTINLNANGVLSTNRTFTAGAAGKGIVNLNGGTFLSTGTAAGLAASVTANVGNGGVTFDTGTGNAIAVAANLTPTAGTAGGLTKAGTGVLTLSGTNTYAGNTTVNAGTLAASLIASLPGYNMPGKVTVAGGAAISFGYGSAGSFAASDIQTAQTNVTFGPGAGFGLDVATGVTATYASNLGGFPNFIKTSPGTLVLAGTNTYTGSTTLAAGLLAVGPTPTTGGLPTTSTIVFNNGGIASSDATARTFPNVVTQTGASSFTFGSATTFTGPLTFTDTTAVAIGNGATRNFAVNVPTTLSQGLAGTALTSTKSGPGLLTLNGASTGLTGTFTIAAGSGAVRLGNGTALGTSAIVVNGQNADVAQLQLAGNITVGNTISFAASRNDPTSATAPGVAGILNVSGNNTITTGGLAIPAGGLGDILQSDAGTLTILGNLTGNTSGSAYARPYFLAGAGNGVLAGNISNGSNASSGAVGTNVVKLGTGQWTLSGNNTFAGGVTVSAGTLVAASNSAVGTGPATVAAGATLAVSANASGGRTVLAVSSLNLSSGAGRIDVAANDLDLPGASLSAVTAVAAQGFAGGTWNGSGGIVSATAAADAAHLTAVGVIQNNGSTGSPIFGNGTTAPPFDRAAVGPSDILVKYTYYGDANLDGVVNAADYALIDAGSIMGLTGWQNGDFNYDGVVDGSDYSLMDNAFNQQSTALAANVPAGPTAAPAALVAAVPEPASLAVIAAGAAGLLGSRRRRRVTCRL